MFSCSPMVRRARHRASAAGRPHLSREASPLRAVGEFSKNALRTKLLIQCVYDQRLPWISSVWAAVRFVSFCRLCSRLSKNTVFDPVS